MVRAGGAFLVVGRAGRWHGRGRAGSKGVGEGVGGLGYDRRGVGEWGEDREAVGEGVEEGQMQMRVDELC